MARRVEQLNQFFIEKLAILISKEIPMDNGLITISHAEVSPDLAYAKISISVLPDNMTGTALKKLRQMNSLFASVLRKEMRLRQIPKFNWVVDSTEKHAAVLEQAITEALKADREENI